MNFSDLGTAAMSGKPDLVRQALAQQPDINACEGPSGFTPLLSAVAGTDSQQRQEIIELLHTAGADMDKRATCSA